MNYVADEMWLLFVCVNIDLEPRFNCVRSSVLSV